MNMDDNDLEVLDCPETPRETPEPCERTSNIAVDLVGSLLHLHSTPYNFLPIYTINVYLT